jgi:hypothetical protein
MDLIIPLHQWFYGMTADESARSGKKNPFH